MVEMKKEEDNNNVYSLFINYALCSEPASQLIYSDEDPEES